MNEIKLAVFRFAADKLVPSAVDQVKMLPVDLASHPDLAGELADWEAISHQIVPVQDDVLLTVLLQKKVEVPDTPDGL